MHQENKFRDTTHPNLVKTIKQIELPRVFSKISNNSRQFMDDEKIRMRWRSSIIVRVSS